MAMLLPCCSSAVLYRLSHPRRCGLEVEIRGRRLLLKRARRLRSELRPGRIEGVLRYTVAGTLLHWCGVAAFPVQVSLAIRFVKLRLSFTDTGTELLDNSEACL